jgi:GTP-binding protein
MKEFEARIREQLKFMPYAPIEYVSCESGQRLHKVLERTTKVREQQDIRITTGELNRIFDEASEGIPPPVVKARPLKMYYATQVSGRPPTFVIFCNDPERVHFSYERYLINQLRQRYPFDGLPVRILWRGKKGRDK